MIDFKKIARLSVLDKNRLRRLLKSIGFSKIPGSKHEQYIAPLDESGVAMKYPESPEWGHLAGKNIAISFSMGSGDITNKGNVRTIKDAIYAAGFKEEFDETFGIQLVDTSEEDNQEANGLALAPYWTNYIPEKFLREDDPDINNLLKIIKINMSVEREQNVTSESVSMWLNKLKTGSTPTYVEPQELYAAVGILESKDIENIAELLEIKNKKDYADHILFSINYLEDLGYIKSDGDRVVLAGISKLIIIKLSKIKRILGIL